MVCIEVLIMGRLHVALCLFVIWTSGCYYKISPVPPVDKSFLNNYPPVIDVNGTVKDKEFTAA